MHDYFMNTYTVYSRLCKISTIGCSHIIANSLLADALFLVFTDRRKETLFLPSANSKKRASASKEHCYKSIMLKFVDTCRKAILVSTHTGE